MMVAIIKWVLAFALTSIHLVAGRLAAVGRFLVQVELTDDYKHAPIVPAANTLTLVKKETGIG
jgi:hypothetical protein